MSLEAILSGQEAVPPQGARIDIAFEGHARGRLSGKVQGVDYLRLRADGRFDLDIRATIETDDGQGISLSGDGVTLAHPGNTVVELSKNVRLTTVAANYAW